jgi:hypothetical protein
MTWQQLDEQLAKWSDRLTSAVKITASESRKLATNIALEVRFLPQDAKASIIGASPISLSDRVNELIAFQGWMDIVRRSPSKSSHVVRAQVITQNYICFVYLPESCFRALSKAAPTGSVTRRCAQFLSDNPIRAFRNAIAHANWTYRDDFGALIYWARKGSGVDEVMEKFEVPQDELSFWQALSRCVAYAAFSNL